MQRIIMVDNFFFVFKCLKANTIKSLIVKRTEITETYYEKMFVNKNLESNLIKI